MNTNSDNKGCCTHHGIAQDYGNLGLPQQIEGNFLKLPNQNDHYRRPPQLVDTMSAINLDLLSEMAISTPWEKTLIEYGCSKCRNRKITVFMSNLSQFSKSGMLIKGSPKVSIETSLVLSLIAASQAIPGIHHKVVVIPLNEEGVSFKRGWRSTVVVDALPRWSPAWASAKIVWVQQPFLMLSLVLQHHASKAAFFLQMPLL